LPIKGNSNPSLRFSRIKMRGDVRSVATFACDFELKSKDVRQAFSSERGPP
jgi:hypothetical protein